MSKNLSETKRPGIVRARLNDVTHFLDVKQSEIYKGLRSIGPEIAAFYLDGVRILRHNNLETKSYLLAHVAREIEGGLREVLSSKEEVKAKKEETAENFDHILSIAVALGVEPDDLFVRKWFGVATRFSKFAHRHGAMKPPRAKSEFENLWKEFEDILFNLLGSYYKLLARIDRILAYEMPTKEILDTLPNLLQLEARRSYFFGNLKWLQWLRPLEERGYFDPEKNPKPQEVSDQPGHYRIPVWDVLKYLEFAANKNSENPSDDVTNLLIEIINSLASYKNNKGQRVDNAYTDWILVKTICALPIERIQTNHIEFIGTALKTKWHAHASLISTEINERVLPKLLTNGAKDRVVKLVDIILEKKEVDGVTFEKYQSVMDEYWLNETLQKHRSEIAKLCGVEAAEIAVDKIRAIIRDDESRFNAATIPTVEDSSQSHFATDYEYQVVRFARDMYELSDPERIRAKIAALTKEEHPIFKRLAIHIINYHYDSLKRLFWRWGGNPLEERFLMHELYELLKGRCSSFSGRQIERVIEWIETKDYYVPEEIKDDVDRKRIEAMQKKEWLLALLETKDERIVSCYKKYHETNPTEIAHPGFPYWLEVGSGLTRTIEPDVFRDKTNSEIAEHLTSYESTGRLTYLSRIDLASAFEGFVSSNPERFSNDLKPFRKIDYMYQCALLRGFEEAWRKKGMFSWEPLLDFIHGIIKSEKFWREAVKERKNNGNLIVSQIAHLIEEGTREDAHSFDAKLLPMAERILLILGKNVESKLGGTSDLLTRVLNSPAGSVFSSIITYSLRYARVSKEKRDDKWPELIKADLNERLDKGSKPSIELSFTLGRYLPNVYFLDRKWVVDNVNRIFPKDNSDCWIAAFTGYAISSNTVYGDLYSLLKENGHYIKALNTRFTDDYVTKALVAHVCLGYMEDWEKLDDETSLIRGLIDVGYADQLRELVRFFRAQRDKLTGQMREKVKSVWGTLFDRLMKDREKPEYQRIISHLLTWLALVDEIDDQILGYLKTSVSYIESKTDELLFIEDLLRHVATEPAKVSEIYLEMLDAGIYAEFRKNQIQQIIQALYDQGQREAANKICNRYGEAGFDFLRATYRQNQTFNSKHTRAADP